MNSPGSLVRAVRGFTLVELLTVISIISLMLAATLPAVTSMMISSRGRTAVELLSSRLANAAARAQARNQTIWVGIRQNSEGLSLLTYDGEPFARKAARGESLFGVSLVAVEKLESFFPSGLPDGVDLTTISSGLAPSTPGVNSDEQADYWLVFNPKGEMHVRADGTLLRQLLIGISANLPPNSPPRYPAVIAISGLTGRNQAFLP